MKRRIVPLVLILALLLPGCGGEPAAEETPSPAATAAIAAVTPPPEPTPYAGPLNPLSGLPIDAEHANSRPFAIMLNNLKVATPQLGVSQADILYEVLAEGGITRMLGLFQSVTDLEKVGSIRSARPYYIELALGHDALYIHAGGSDPAYEKLSTWRVDHFDGVRGPYMSNTEGQNMMWRDSARRKTMGKEHSVVATGASLEATLPETVRRLHPDGWPSSLSFTEDGTPQNGSPANKLTVPFSQYKTGVFTYDPATKLYMIEEYGAPYVDGNTGGQVGVTNVLVLKAACKNTGDSYAHITVDLTGGTGYYACGGKLMEISWSKGYPDGQMRYADASGQPFSLGAGHTYVNIIPLENTVTVE